MKQWILYISVLLFLGIFNYTSAQEYFDNNDPLFSLPKVYHIHYTNEVPIIDGLANEEAWKKVSWSDEFIDIEGEGKSLPTFQTRYKMMWDETNLYIFAKLYEEHIWAYYTTADMIVYHENDFEVFIDPDGDTHNYYEFELNAKNTLFDLFMNKPYRNGGKANIAWNANGFRSAVYCEGTLNNAADKDSFWSVEIAIPFAALTTNGQYFQPTDGSNWKINFSRVQWQTNVVDGKYIRRKDVETGKLLPEDNWVWSPQGVINMHYPERWGIGIFAKSEDDNIPADLIENELLAQYLWAIYYKQKKYFNINKKFANELESLELSGKVTEAENDFQVFLTAEDQTFVAELKTSDGRYFSVNQDGKFVKPTKN